MKKKVWVLSPYAIIVTLLLFLLALLNIMWNSEVFLIEVCIAIAALVLAILEVLKFKSYVKSTIKNVNSKLYGVNTNVLQALPVPVVVVGQKEDIIFFNRPFFSNVSNNRDCTGEIINQFIPGKTLKYVLKHRGLDIAYAGRRYTVFGAALGEATILYFLDDTYYKETTFEYMQSRPVVCMAVFDNKEEILRENHDGHDAQIVADFERELQRWADSTTGFLKKLDSDRYMLIFEDRHIKAFIDNKFSILEKVRTIKLDNRKYATISIGIGRGASNLHESELWAKKALDMALGRGGDQVAIKKSSSYQFFGGKSKGTEKRDRVRTRVIASTMVDHIKNSDCVLIMGHKFSDLDSIGASVGLWSSITKGQETSAYIVVNRDQSLATQIINMVESTGNKNMFISPSQALGIISDKTLLIIVDTHSQNFLESKEIYDSCKNVVIIDHHRLVVNYIKNSIVFYHEPYASSASEMVTELVQYIGENSLDNFEAEALLAGIMLDTKNFIMKTGVRTFEAAAFLKRKGADTVEVKKLFSNSLETYREKSNLISKAEIINKCAITSAEKDKQNVRLACAQVADELLEIQGVKASFVIYPSEDSVNISARSMGDVNVQLVMEELGGGGHQTMAGAQIKNISINKIKELLIKTINSLDTQ